MNQLNSEQMSKMDSTGVKGLRDNAVFVSGLLINTYEVIESQILRTAYAEPETGSLNEIL
jgi:hypothetical protein